MTDGSQQSSCEGPMAQSSQEDLERELAELEQDLERYETRDQQEIDRYERLLAEQRRRRDERGATDPPDEQQTTGLSDRLRRAKTRLLRLLGLR